MKESLVALSFDIDWAHDDVVADTIAILDRFDAKATFFATHDSAVLRSLDRTRYEIGIHPNFNPLLDGTGSGTFQRTLDAMLDLYPEARGLRSHSLTTSGNILAYARSRGIRYESNYYAPTQLPPFRDYDGLVRMPMYWLDYRELLAGPEFATEEFRIARDIPALFAFHPVHVFLNTDTGDRYARNKVHLQEPELLAKGRNVERPGVRDVLVCLLERCQRESYTTVRMIDVVDAHEAVHGSRIGRPPNR